MRFSTQLELDRKIYGKLAGTHSLRGYRGLYLSVKPPANTRSDGEKSSAKGSNRWVFRTIEQTADGNKRTEEMSLGSYPAISMAEAASKAVALWELRKRGGAEWAARKDTDYTQVAPVAKSAVVVTLRDEAMEYRERNAPRYHNGQKVGGWDQAYYRNWLGGMEKHVLCHLGDRDSATITGQEFARVLRPIWHLPVGFKTLTALNAVYERAVELGKNSHRLMRNPIPDCRAELPPIGERERNRQVTPHGMMTAEQVAELYRKTATAPITCFPAKALQFLLLVGCVRSAEVLGARWDDITGDTFRVPGERTKSGNDRTIPLVSEAVDLLTALRDVSASDYVFPSLRKQGDRQTASGEPFAFTGHLQDDAMRIWLQTHHQGVDAETGKRWDVHGLRHAYTGWVRSWATIEQYWCAEFGLDHVIKDQSAVQRAYDRDTKLPERRAILRRWADHLTG